MPNASQNLSATPLPTLNELGNDLLAISRLRQATTLAIPFIAMGSYWLFAWLHWWSLAVVSVMVLSFVTYGVNGGQKVQRGSARICSARLNRSWSRPAVEG